MSDLLRYPTDAVIIAALVALVLIVVLERAERNVRARTLCLKIAADSYATFYSHAERVLNNPATPAAVSDLLLHLIDAASDDDKGRQAFGILVEVLDDGPRDRAADPALNAFRAAAPEMYEEFSDALRALMTAIVLTYGPSSDRIALESRSTTELQTTYALAKRIGDFISELAANGDARTGPERA